MLNLNKKLDTLSSNYSTRNKRNKTRQRFIVILLILAFMIFVPSIFIYLGAKEVSVHGNNLINAYKMQNFDSLKKEMEATKGGLQKVDMFLNFFFWLRIIPFIGGYYSDVKGFVGAGVEELNAFNTIMTNLEPSKSELMFDGNPKAGPDRMTQAVRVLNKSIPSLNKVENNFKKGAKLVENINTSKYPEKIKNRELRKNLEVAKNFIVGAALAVAEGKEALLIAPELLGIGSAKNYLLLFQNDKEIRPTGGFMTAYATLKIENGQVSATTSDDIYRLDEKLLKVCLTKICPLKPPAPIVKYLPEVTGKVRTAWSMRDANISPNVPTSAKEFERMYQLLGEGLPFDGIIFIDTQVVEELIEVIGPIDVYGTVYSAETDKRCNCPNVIYELESYAEIAAKGEKDRKAILGVLMQQILARSVGADVEKLPQLVETIARLANHKHVMFFMHDQKSQQALSKLNWTGEIKDVDGDYLHINDSNFAGGKSNLYVNQKVSQEINVQKDGTVKKKITIEYSNDQPFSIWLNGINRDYVRFYVPAGSKLVSSKGSEVSMTTIEDLNKTVFEAFIQVRPQNKRKLKIEYQIPYNPKGEYKLMVQKQPGAKDFEYRIKLNGKQVKNFKLDTDYVFTFPL